MGLGSIIGTGIFVSAAIATQVSGNGIVIAIVIAAILETFNGFSSAQLAATHPVSGGTYEYGNRFLNSYFGFTAGWMFLIAKSASAATAVLGCVGYLYLAVSLTALQVMGADAFRKTVDGEAAPLMTVAQALSVPVIGPVITIAAITAMLGRTIEFITRSFSGNSCDRVLVGLPLALIQPNRLNAGPLTHPSPILLVYSFRYFITY